MLLGTLPIRVFWVCDTCGASGEIDTELPVLSLDELDVEDAAVATLTAVQAVSHPHPVRPNVPRLC